MPKVDSIDQSNNLNKNKKKSGLETNYSHRTIFSLLSDRQKPFSCLY